MEPVVEPNEEVQLNFAGCLPDELNRDANILVATDKCSKFPTAKVVTNTTADFAIKFKQKYNSITGYPKDQDATKRKNLELKHFNCFAVPTI